MTKLPPKQIASAAALVMAGCLVAGCGKRVDQAGWWQDEQQRIGLSQQLELKKYRYEQVNSHDLEQLESLRLFTTGNVALLKSLRKQHQSLVARIESMEGQWAEFRESTIRDQRQHAMGKTFEKLSLVSGRTFVNASVASIDDAGVTIRHADGSARLRFADLDSKQRVFFGLEADLALAAEEQETRDAADYELWVGKQLVAINEKKLRDAENARLEDLETRRLRSQSFAQLAASSAVRPLARPATSVGDRSWSYSNSYSNYRAHRPTRRYVYYYNSSPYPCQPSSVNVHSGRAASPKVYKPPVVRKHKSLTNTSQSSIP